MADIILNGTAAGPASLGSGRSAAHAMLTYADAVDLAVAFLRGHGDDTAQETIRAAIQAAHLDVVSAHDWPSLERPGRVHLHAAQSTGTVSYDHSTRQLTLSGATWPEWVEDGTLWLDQSFCEVEAYVSSTVIVLHEILNPGKSLAAGTSYELLCRWYPLPADFVNFTGPMGRNAWAYGQPISMPELSAYQRNHRTTGTIQYYAIGERPNAIGEKAIYPWPFAPASEPLDFTYQRRPRELQYSGHDAADQAGTIAVVAGSNSVVGTGTQFESDMAGAVLRIGRDGTNWPTGRYGLHRFAEQKRIHSSSTATALALTSNVETSRADVKYVITDPVDLEPCAKNAFLRYVELHLAMTRKKITSIDGRRNISEYRAVAEQALREAMAASWPTRYDPAVDRAAVGPQYVDPSVWENL